MLNAARPLAAALAALGLLALIPAIVEARAGGVVLGAYLATSAYCLFLALMVRFTTDGRALQLRRAHGLAGLMVLWLVLPLASTPAVAVASGLSPLAAWLEAVSAFTTTGITSLRQAPASLYVWLALLQWCGGLLTVVSVVAVLAPAGLGGLPDRTARGGMALDAVDIRGVARDTAPLYLGLTVLAVLVLMIDGHSLYVSFTLATAVASAGAHLPPEAQLALTLDESPKWLLLPFLLWSATSVRWHRALVTRRIHTAPEQKESLIVLAYWAVLGLLFGVLLFRGSDVPPLAAVRDGLFTAASLIATSGIGPHEGTYANLPMGLVIAVVLLGGGALSVAGGLKMLRLRAMLLRARGDLLRLVYPNLVQPASLGEGGVGSAMRGVWVGAAALFAVYGLLIIALAPGLPGLDAALAAGAAIISNTGPVYDAGGGWPPMGSLPAASVLVAGFGMIAGRLEVIGFFVLLHLALWRT
ncbi:hypothetical protein [Xanthobacter agilis]|uniref:Trk system potassium uptake protein TrkH n=1 Tax=Xanthobacter agilis TaxID=47492 RepID=A0ABU0LAY4_XANAG|nr:hypothetical protein [Xanthobacter agilis]MDQ0504293.1 trk system potassium uptake protein TrkH [Xanthobacter agilis]